MLRRYRLFNRFFSNVATLSFFFALTGTELWIFKNQHLMCRKKINCLEIQLLCLLLKFGVFEESTISMSVRTEIKGKMKVPISTLKLVRLHTKKGLYKSMVKDLGLWCGIKCNLKVLSNTDQQLLCTSSSSSPPSLASFAYSCAPLPCPALTLSLTYLLVLGHGHVNAFAAAVEVSKKAEMSVFWTLVRRGIIKRETSFTELFQNPGN